MFILYTTHDAQQKLRREMVRQNYKVANNRIKIFATKL